MEERIVRKRIHSCDREEKYNYYEVRYLSTDDSVPYTVERNVAANFYGTIILPFEIELKKGEYCHYNLFIKKVKAKLFENKLYKSEIKEIKEKFGDK